MHQEQSAGLNLAASASNVGYRDVLVHLDGSSEDEIRIAHAEYIATLFNAHVTGLYTSALPDINDYSAPAAAMAYAELYEHVRDEQERTRSRLTARIESLPVPSELRTIAATMNEITRSVADPLRTSDLFIASCPLNGWGSIVEAALFEGAHGILLAPEGVKPRDPIRTILFAWVNTREAARGASEALPLLRLATSVEIFSVEEKERTIGDAMRLADIAAHLDRHGVSVDVNTAHTSLDVAGSILDEAHRISADLIVAGAYGHSRFREWFLGGATRDLIARSDIPLLMAH